MKITDKQQYIKNVLHKLQFQLFIEIIDIIIQEFCTGVNIMKLFIIVKVFLSYIYLFNVQDGSSYLHV